MPQINIPNDVSWGDAAAAINSMNTELYSATGWANHADTQYTTGSRLSVTANIDTNLPNNRGSVIESQKPIDISAFYDGTVITGRNGDDIIISIDFTVVPNEVGTTLIEVWLDITGGTGTPLNLANLYRRAFNFPKGTGVERKISFSQSGYTLGTWQDNGAVVKVRTNGAASIFDVGYIIKRTHKAV